MFDLQDLVFVLHTFKDSSTFQGFGGLFWCLIFKIWCLFFKVYQDFKLSEASFGV